MIRHSRLLFVCFHGNVYLPMLKSHELFSLTVEELAGSVPTTDTFRLQMTANALKPKECSPHLHIHTVFLSTHFNIICKSVRTSRISTLCLLWKLPLIPHFSLLWRQQVIFCFIWPFFWSYHWNTKNISRTIHYYTLIITGGGAGGGHSLVLL
jgi:hypothetical protein